jgi:hypothetical protein
MYGLATQYRTLDKVVVHLFAPISRRQDVVIARQFRGDIVPTKTERLIQVTIALQKVYISLVDL